MNQYDVEDMYTALANRDEVPNLQAGAKTLYRLMRYANSHSDGWAYWRKPSAASKRLQERLKEIPLSVHRNVMGEITDISEAELKRLLSPIKAFLTKQGIDHDEVIWLPERDSRQRTVATIEVRIYLPHDLSTMPEAQAGRVKIALESLADVMGVQAEDGLYLLGYKEAEEGVIDGRDVENEFVSDIARFTTGVVLGTYEVTREEARGA